VAVVAAPLGLALAIRNLWLYGDLTGFGAFDQLHRLESVDTSLTGFVRTVISLPNHFWLVWWKGSDVGQNGLLMLFYTVMAIVVIAAWARLFSELWHQQRGEKQATYMHEQRNAALIYGVAVITYAVAVLNSYYEGMVPVIQGRFMLPVMVPFVLLLVWGLWHFVLGEQILLGVVVLLWVMGLLFLFGNMIPYFYYWSGVLEGTMPPPAGVSAIELLTMVYQRTLFDKPPLLAPLLVVLPLCYGLMLLLVFTVTLRAVIRSRHWRLHDATLPAHS
jgi:hypothetical protein